MKINLKGYFDRNFGDDYMFKIVADSFPDIDFIVERGGEISDVITTCKNIIIKEKHDTDCLTLKVTGSGFMINSREAFLTELVWFLKRKKDADVCINCNIEPFKNKVYEFLIAHKLNKYSLITCRDKYSLKWLTKHTKKPKIKYHPDILFALDVPKAGEGKKLGIALLHRSGDAPECDYYKKMAQIADWWIQTTGQNVVLVAFDSGEEDDVYACDCVERLIENKDKVECVMHSKGGEIAEAFSQCCKIIGARFHSVVLAIKMGIDVYPIVFRKKTKNLLEDIGYPIKGTDISDVQVEKIKKFILAGIDEFSFSSDYKRKAKCHIEALKEFLINYQKSGEENVNIGK